MIPIDEEYLLLTGKGDRSACKRVELVAQAASAENTLTQHVFRRFCRELLSQDSEGK
jgi:hypothetical protein